MLLIIKEKGKTEEWFKEEVTAVCSVNNELYAILKNGHSYKVCEDATMYDWMVLK